MKKVVEDSLEVLDKLDFIQEQVMHAWSTGSLPHEVTEGVWVTQGMIAAHIEGKAENMTVIDALMEQIIPEQLIEQIGLAAAAHTGNDLDESIVLGTYQLLQVQLSGNSHDTYTSLDVLTEPDYVIKLVNRPVSRMS